MSTCPKSCCSKTKETEATQRKIERISPVDSCCSKPSPACSKSGNEKEPLLAPTNGKKDDCCSKNAKYSTAKKNCSQIQGDSCCDIEKGVCSDQTPLIKKEKPHRRSWKGDRAALRQGTSIRFEVRGMTCSDCAARLEAHIWKIPSITDVTVSALTHKVEVWTSSSDRAAISKSVIEGAEALGFSGKEIPSVSITRLLVQLPSANPLSSDETALKPLRESRGVVDVKVLPGNQLEIDYSTDAAPRDLLSWIEQRCGAPVSILPPKHREAEDSEASRWGVLMIAAAFLAIPVLLIEQFLPLWPAAHRFLDLRVVGGLTLGALLQWVLSTPVQFAVAAPLYISAWKCAWSDHSANMDTLVVLSSSTAYVYSCVELIRSAIIGQELQTFFETSAILIALVMLGRYLDVLAKRQAAGVLAPLLNLQAKSALLVQRDSNGGETVREIPMELMQRGDTLRVLPGARIPTDGEVLSGESSVDESCVTGEAVHVSKRVGSAVFAGSVNQLGLLHIRATRSVAENTLANIGRLVEEAQAVKTPTQRIADRVAAYFVPAIILGSAACFVLWFSLARAGKLDTGSQNSISFALQFALSTLVVSCPCAIALAVPTAIMVGTSVGAQHGVLFKSGAALEAMHRVQTIIFDKTGTLTTGQLRVTDIRLLDETFDRQLVLRLVLFAESGSEHPLAKALVAFAQNELKSSASLVLSSPQQLHVSPGRGLQCIVGEEWGALSNSSLAVGSRDYITTELRIPLAGNALTDVTSLEEDGCSIVAVALGGKVIALLGLRDELRPETVDVVRALQREKVAVYLLSGDNARAACAVGRRAGIPATNVIAGVLPADKASHVQRLQNGNESVVAMVGDGINDAPALAQADVGIAVVSGTDMALAAADVVLLKSDLRDVVGALQLAHKVFSRIRLNFCWALLYNLIAIPLATGALWPLWHIHVPPAWAGISEIVSSIPVVIFSLLLKFYAPPRV